MTLYYLMAAGGLLLLGLVAGMRPKKCRRPQETQDYTDALHHLIDGDLDAAVVGLKKVVKRDSDNVMAYIELGAIFRMQGHAQRASKVHRHLLVRGNLPDALVQRVLHQLVLDYRAMGALERAVEMAERLNERNKKSPAFQQLLLELYEAKGEWDKALMYQQSVNRWQKHKDQPKLALYKVQSGLGWIRRGAEREGRIRFREAIRLNRKCLPAYLYWGDSYIRVDRPRDAVKVWRDFTERHPAWAHLAFDRLSETLFDLGQFDQMESIYRKVIDKKPGRPEAALGLARFYQKQGRTDEAVALAKSAVDAHAQSPAARLLLATLLKQQGNPERALDEALSLLADAVTEDGRYTCSACGHTQSDVAWRCPQCGAWNSFLEDETP